MSSPRLLSNRYEIGDTLGYGGMSEVHRGRDVRLGRDVAVKVLRADLARDPTFQLRFRREAQNAAALNHPAIVAVYDTGETESENGPLPYIVMEYVDGRTLRDIVKTEGPLTPRRAMEVMADASAALDFSHRHGIVHRDVKPANIMITRSGAVKVMDFGIARALADGQAAVTQTAAVIGTAQYLSPEQARGETVDARSDVYASGCVLFELLTGEPPFTGDSPVAVAYQHVREDPRKPSDVNETVPASLDAVVLKALSKNPANRYQSAAEMRADLVRVLSGQRPKAPMIMSDEERTSMMAAPQRTEVMNGGRHRPDSLADPEDDYDGEHERKRRKRWMIALVTAACVGVFALVAWIASLMLAGPGEPQQVAVPELRNQVEQAARMSAEQEGWTVAIRDVESRPEDQGKVVNQSPLPRTMALKTERLTLFVGRGPGQATVPDLRGKKLADASAELKQAQLELDLARIQEEETDDPDMVGKVVSQKPEAMSKLLKGQSVSIVLGKAAEKSPVPPVVGQQFDMARQILEAARFRVLKRSVPSDQPANTVIAQTPEANSSAKSGSVVTLSISDGSQLTMPNLSDKSPTEAMAALKAMGWNGQASESKQPTSDISMQGKVVSTSPASGQTLTKNQSVIFYVGEYDSNPSSTPPTDDTSSLWPPFG
jgi:serine/threonine-protein kinase